MAATLTKARKLTAFFSKRVATRRYGLTFVARLGQPERGQAELPAGRRESDARHGRHADEGGQPGRHTDHLECQVHRYTDDGCRRVEFALAQQERHLAAQYIAENAAPSQPRCTPLAPTTENRALR